MTTAGLAGLRVVAFESRRGSELGQLIRHHGGEAITAPALAEVSTGGGSAAKSFADALLAGKVDLVVLLTGVGTLRMAEEIEQWHSRESWLAALSRTTVVVRSRKPLTALRSIGGPEPAAVAAEPNTSREVLAALAGFDLKGRRVAVQEHGAPPAELLAGLAEMGAEVLRVPTYEYAMPENTEPLRAAIGEIVAGRVDAAVFTAPGQVRNFVALAGSEGMEENVRLALPRIVVAAVGPSTRQELEQHGIAVDLEPAEPRMGQLVHTLAQQARTLLEGKGRG